MVNDLVASFKPTDKIPSLRSNQTEALNALYDKLQSGFKLIECEMPAGSGKSVFANTVMDYFASLGINSMVTSPQNMQVDQYARAGFEGMVTLKGREHYECIAGKENCSKGFCTTKKCPDGETKRNCIKREYSQCRNCICNDCLYKAEFRRFKDSTKGNTNFPLLLLGITNKPGVLIIDEADTCESSVRSFNSIVIPELFPHYRFPEIVPDLLNYVEKCALEIRSLQRDDNTDTEEKRLKFLEDQCNSILEICSDYKTHKEPWCVTEKRSSMKTKIEPVTINRFLRNIFQQKIVIMMSATPPHYPEFEKIRVESIFPVSTRQWIYDPFPGSMVLKQRDASIPRAAVWLSTLKGKCLVHCKSYETAEKLHRALRIIKRSSLLQVNTNGDESGTRYSRYDAVSAFLKSRNPDEILISVNQGRGLDLWQPEIIWNVILVVPWINPTDPLAKLKTEILGESWKNQDMANEITQMIARHFRNDKMGVYQGIPTPKKAAIIDASFGRWYNTNIGLFPKNFTESQRL